MNAFRNPFVRFPGILFALFLGVVGTLIWESTKVTTDTDPLTLLESDKRHQETYDRIQSFLSDDTVVVISVERAIGYSAKPASITSAPSATRLANNRAWSMSRA